MKIKLSNEQSNNRNANERQWKSYKTQFDLNVCYRHFFYRLIFPFPIFGIAQCVVRIITNKHVINESAFGASFDSQLHCRYYQIK